jgi:hypothetical protein
MTECNGKESAGKAPHCPEEHDSIDIGTRTGHAGRVFPLAPAARHVPLPPLTGNMP